MPESKTWAIATARMCLVIEDGRTDKQTEIFLGLGLRAGRRLANKKNSVDRWIKGGAHAVIYSTVFIFIAGSGLSTLAGALLGAAL